MKYSCGRNGEAPSNLLGDQLERLGLEWTRLKTGTPPRLDGRTIEWARFEAQRGDADPTPFSFLTSKIEREQIQCYIAYTTDETLRILRDSIARSPLYSGQIEGIGPALLPFDRGQGRQVPGQDPASDLPGARGPGHVRDLRERHVDQHADRRADGDAWRPSRARKRRDDPARLCHRV